MAATRSASELQASLSTLSQKNRSEQTALQGHVLELEGDRDEALEQASIAQEELARREEEWKAKETQLREDLGRSQPKEEDTRLAEELHRELLKAMTAARAI